jgi:Brp/Blh family beta-carotene 15,15'-monooxygenase
MTDLLVPFAIRPTRSSSPSSERVVTLPPIDLRSPAVFWSVVTTTLAVAAVASVWSPPDWLSLTAFVVVIAVLGIPHGAADHLVIEAIDGRRHGARRRFVARYLLAMAAVAIVWSVAPGFALAVFLAMSVHHFGQSDLAYLRLPGRRQVLLQWSRGLFLVGLPIVAHLAAVSPVVERLGGGDPSSWPWLADHWWLWSVLLVGQHLVIGAAIAHQAADRSFAARETVTVAALTFVFLLVDPLLGFAVYFGLWHSLGHLFVLTDLLGSEPPSARSVARFAAPLIVLSLVGLAALAGGALVAGRVEALLPLAVVAAAMLTAPHMAVVERLWRR